MLLKGEEDRYLDLCLSCFSNIDEFSGEYHIVSKLDFPLLESHWTAQEELLLFEGL